MSGRVAVDVPLGKGAETATRSTPTHHMGVHPGDRCRDCRLTEQDCAWTFPCCAECTHWLRYDYNGNPFIGRIPKRLVSA